MLRRLAGAIAESRDFCSYWEIDHYDRPAPAASPITSNAGSSTSTG